eukprot:TRINITY_DN8023_c0_g2_i1.p1 TRINITY_DN8023_c0_g2~~TRINITY_DN8023_c0_g2_i1.p1  ORF type:complete len:106 (+),score=22.62 TRINITY_DN8023_c0_g2_i1:630-947(+)
MNTKIQTCDEDDSIIENMLNVGKAAGVSFGGNNADMCSIKGFQSKDRKGKSLKLKLEGKENRSYKTYIVQTNDDWISGFKEKGTMAALQCFFFLIPFQRLTSGGM